jgi:hypothetical protein
MFMRDEMSVMGMGSSLYTMRFNAGFSYDAISSLSYVCFSFDPSPIVRLKARILIESMDWYAEFCSFIRMICCLLLPPSLISTLRAGEP